MRRRRRLSPLPPSGVASFPSWTNGMCTQAQADNERGRPKGRERVAGRSRCCCGGSRCCRRSHTRTHMHGEKTRISPPSLLREGGRRLRRHPPPSPVGVGRRSPSCCSPIFWTGLGQGRLKGPSRERKRKTEEDPTLLPRSADEGNNFSYAPFFVWPREIGHWSVAESSAFVAVFLHLQLICWLHSSCL